jgi:hypothetical protein
MVKVRVALLLIGIFALSAIIGLAHATVPRATVATLDIRDSTGAERVDFNFGETVYFNWTANGQVDINVYFDNGTLSQSWLSQPSTGQVSYVPPEPGYYYVECTGARPRVLAVGTFLVIPDVPFGPILSIVASLAAFGIIMTRRRPR